MSKIYLLLMVFLVFTAATMVSCTKDKIDNFYQSEFVPGQSIVDSTAKVELLNISNPSLTSPQQKNHGFLFDMAIQMDVEGQYGACKLRVINH